MAERQLLDRDPRVCIIGAGALSSRRIYPYIAPAGARLVGVCDLDQKRAEERGAIYNASSYTDWQKMLDEQSPDGVIVCIGPAAHAELAPQILRRGLPVYTEKPPAPDAKAAAEVARVSRETGMPCMTAFKKRFAQCYDRARQFIDAHDPARLLSLSMNYASGSYAKPGRSSLHTLLLDFGIHAIDLLAYLGGEVETVYAATQGDRAYAVSLRYASGAVGTLSLNDGRSFGIPTESVEITSLSDAGCAFMSIENSSRWRIVEGGKPTEWREPPTFVSSGDSGRDTGHLAELEAFMALLRDPSDPRKAMRSSIEQSCRSMAVYEAIAASAESGKVEKVQYPAVS